MIDVKRAGPLDMPVPPARRAPASGTIGEILVREGSLSPSDLLEVVKWQSANGIRFGEAAVKLGFIKDADVRLAMARQYEYPYIKGHDDSTIDPRVFAAHQPFDRRAESLRTLRSQLALRWFSEERRALAVFAPQEGEEGSILAANLAVTFAQLGERTLLIDADMRAPQQHTLFGVRDSRGLSTVLGGRCTFSSALVQVRPFRALSLLCAGAAAPNPQELLTGDTFATLLALTQTNFRVVILSAPPALGCADAQIVAARAGGCLVVARRHHSTVRDLRRVAASMSSCGSQILGVTISD